MPKMLNISPDLKFPLQAVTSTFGILAVTGAGKSNSAVVMAEEMYDAGLPWVAIDPKGDWWGVRSSGDGKSAGLAVIVFGGEHGDVPLEPTAGAMVADLIVEHRLTCVLDVSEMTKADQRRFLIGFAERLYKRNREPLHVFFEEADEYIPQRVMADTAKLVGAMETLVKRGRFRGIGCTLITQRSASLNKDVLTQIGTLIAHRTTSPQDRKAILGWIDYHATSKDIVDDLPQLSNGQAWVFSPQWLRILEKVTFRQRRTFDSGATPEIGMKRREPTKLADINLDSIKDAMAATVEKAKAEDPKFWRQRVAELEREISKMANEADARYVRIMQLEEQVANPLIEVKSIEVSVLTDEDRALIEKLYDAMCGATGHWAEVVHQVSNLLDKSRAVEIGDRNPVTLRTKPIGNVRGVHVPASSLPPLGSPESKVGPNVPRPAKSAQVRAPARIASNEDTQLRKGARRMVEVLGKMAPLRMTTAQWSVIAKVKASGGTWGTYLSDINKLGLVEQNEAGWTLTDAGFDYLGGRPAPLTLEELRALYMSLLRAGARRMLEELVAVYPDGLDLDMLSARSEISRAGGTFGTYLSDLTRNQLVVKDGSYVTATALWFTAP